MKIRSSYDKDEQLTLDLIDNQCDQCLKILASKYGLHYHQSMYHPNQSIICMECNLIFRTHRALKTHQQRFHNFSSEYIYNNNNRYSYLLLPFSTEQFVLLTSNTCEQNRLQLGEYSSKLFQCQFCFLSFPTINSLKYHRLYQHEQYQYEICQRILDEIIQTIEINNDQEFQSIKFTLDKQASNFGLINKQLSRKIHSIKHEQHHLIFPSCEHQNRTCANLCLKNLSSYYQHLQNSLYQITGEPKGNPFVQGSIVSKPSIIPKENLLINHKNPSFKSLSSLKRKHHSSTNLISSKKSLIKINYNYTRSLSSMSSTSSTSTRSSSRKSRQPSKRSASPMITLAVERSSEKRRRQREQRKSKTFSSNIKHKNTTDDNNQIISIMKSKNPRQRESSNSSVEYIQEINHNQLTNSSLNNIENMKLKSPSYNQDIIVCSSSTSINGTQKIQSHQTNDYDEHIRVRCKICGEILDGRNQFSKHVLTKHSHLIKPTLSSMKQQTTSIVYSV